MCRKMHANIQYFCTNINVLLSLKLLLIWRPGKTLRREAKHSLSHVRNFYRMRVRILPPTYTTHSRRIMSYSYLSIWEILRSSSNLDRIQSIRTQYKYLINLLYSTYTNRFITNIITSTHIIYPQKRRRRGAIEHVRIIIIIQTYLFCYDLVNYYYLCKFNDTIIITPHHIYIYLPHTIGLLIVP